MHILPQEFWKFNESLRIPHPAEAMDSGDLHAALNSFALHEMLDYRAHGRCYSDVWVCGFGVVLWMMGDRFGAANVWSKACDEALRGKFKYSSTGTFQSGLLLWFASVWLEHEEWHDEATALIEKLLKKRRPVMGATFPSLLGKLLRREIDLQEIQSTYNKESAHERDWIALFYAGVRAYEDKNSEQTRQLWNQAKEPLEASLLPEYHLLMHERNKLAG